MKEQQIFGSPGAPAVRYDGWSTRSLHIPMRDGVELAADIILPKGLAPESRIPALVCQTRYWRSPELRAPFKWFVEPSSLDAYVKDLVPFFIGQGYALIRVDVRGTGASYGEWPHPWPDDSTHDVHDLAEWIVAQPWSNGRIGGYGVSYLGTTAELMAVPRHPAIRAVAPMFNHPDGYQDIALPGGIFHQRFIEAWGNFDHHLDSNIVPREFGVLGRLMMKGVKPVDGPGSRQLLREAVADHAHNGHAYRLGREITFRDEAAAGKELTVDDTTVARYREELAESHTVSFGWGSWMDAGTADAVIRRFLTFDNAMRAAIGTWEHGGRFHASPYQAPDAAPCPGLRGQYEEMLRFFDAHLKDVDNGVADEKTLFYYTMGEERWHRTSIWPPEGVQMQRWYLHANEALATEAPAADESGDRFSVDFEASTGASNRWWEMAVFDDETVVYPDRSGAEKHALVYTSPPLERDVEITGYPVVTLHVTSSHTDGAFYVYLEDVDPSGRITYVTEGQLRALHRKVSPAGSPYELQVPCHTFRREDAAPLVPDEPAEISFGLHPTSVLIRKGHSFRILIAGHDAGTFVRIPAEGTPTIAIARNRERPSCIDLPMRERS
jgi:putative CocE/NonD family hydrolase